MLKKQLLIVLVLFSFMVSAQEEIKEENVIIEKQELLEDDYNPLAPATAAFYSAVVPGLGQAYNKKYWKIPVIYAALGTSIYFYTDLNKQYNRYRDAYKLRKAGLPDEFTDSFGNVTLSEESLERAQTRIRRERDLALVITFGIYALQIIEASVNAHLLKFNTNKNLSIQPKVYLDEKDYTPMFGSSISFTF